jgi:hypothetical protein
LCNADAVTKEQEKQRVCRKMYFEGCKLILQSFCEALRFRMKRRACTQLECYATL